MKITSGNYFGLYQFLAHYAWFHREGSHIGPHIHHVQYMYIIAHVHVCIALTNHAILVSMPLLAGREGEYLRGEGGSLVARKTGEMT